MKQIINKQANQGAKIEKFVFGKNNNRLLFLYCSVQFDKKQICGTLRDLVPFAQFKKRQNHPLRSVNFSKVADFSLQLY